MKITRPSVKTIEVSDLSAEIAVKLANRHMLDKNYMRQGNYEYDVSKNLIFLIEEAAIIIDEVIKNFGEEVLKES